MSKEEWEAAEAIDPGDPPVVPAPVEEAPEAPDDEFPEPEYIVDEETGRHFIAFEIEPGSIPEEEEKEEGGEE